VFADEFVGVSFDQFTIYYPCLLSDDVATFRAGSGIEEDVVRRAPPARISGQLPVSVVWRLLTIISCFRFGDYGIRWPSWAKETFHVCLGQVGRLDAWAAPCRQGDLHALASTPTRLVQAPGHPRRIEPWGRNQETTRAPTHRRVSRVRSSKNRWFRDPCEASNRGPTLTKLETPSEWLACLRSGKPRRSFAARLPRERAARRWVIPVAQGEKRKRPAPMRRLT